MDTIGLDLTFSGEALKATLFFTFLSVCVLVGLLGYLNRYTRRRYFTIWTVAWMFYGIWLLLNLTLLHVPESGLVFVLKNMCLGTAAVFLLWGSAQFLQVGTNQLQLGLFMFFLLVWSCLGAAHHYEPIVYQVPIFWLVGTTSMITSWGYYQFRKRQNHVGAGLLAWGFLLWGMNLIAFPFLEVNDLSSVGFLLTSVTQLFIAVSMIILVLEEAQRSRDEAAEAAMVQQTQTEFFKIKARATEKRYRVLFEQADEGIAIVAADDLRILELNQKASVLLGIDRGEEANRKISQYIQSDVDGPRDETGQAWFERISQKRQITVERKDGRRFPGEIVGARVNLDGQQAFQLFVRDQTERAQLEQQLRQSEKLSALGQMISGIAHELNNPLAAIKGYLQLILEGHELQPKTREDLKKVAAESNRAAKLVSSFLHFARERPAERVPSNLNELVQRVAELREFECRVAGVELKMALDPALPQTLLDLDEVQQILLNLLNNALHAIVEAPAPHIITIRSYSAEDLIFVEVEDNGPGVPAELVQRIFEPFYTTKEVGTGTGLGLSISHSIMADHNGRIRYRDGDAGGAVFVLEFPIISSSEETTHIAKPEPVRQPPLMTGISADILVLDDERHIAELLAEMLELLSHRPVVCTSPLEALERLKESEFDVIISDFRMPAMNGQQFFLEVQERHPAMAERIIFLTGDVVNEATQSFLGSTGNQTLDKPFQLEKVREAIAHVLSRSISAN